MELIHEADVAVVFGAGLNQFTVRFGEPFAPGTRVFQVDIASSATHPHVGAFLHGEAALCTYDSGPDVAADGRLDPRSAAIRIGEVLPEDRRWRALHRLGQYVLACRLPDPRPMVGTAFQLIGLGFPSVPGRRSQSPTRRSSSRPGTAAV